MDAQFDTKSVARQVVWGLEEGGCPRTVLHLTGNSTTGLVQERIIAPSILALTVRSKTKTDSYAIRILQYGVQK